jgi:hypothetical protein
MKRTLQKLMNHIKGLGMHVFEPGRTTTYCIPDQVYVGVHMLQEQDDLAVEVTAGEDTTIGERELEANDFSV